MLADQDLIHVLFKCCDKQGLIPLGEVRADADMFACPFCGSGVHADHRDLAALADKAPDQKPHEITLRPTR